jgi:hypothetical protein
MQKIFSPKTVMVILAMMLTLSLIACASTKGSKKVEMEKLLTASGFKMAVADTPEKLAQLKKLPQRKVVPHDEGDKIFYIYADVANCNCAYAGDEKAYQKYQKLALKKQLSEEDRRDAVRNQQRQMDSEDSSWGRDW